MKNKEKEKEADVGIDEIMRRIKENEHDPPKQGDHPPGGAVEHPPADDGHLDVFNK